MNTHGHSRLTTPGPGAYNAVSPVRTKKEAPAYSMRPRTKNINETRPNTTPVVGPGRYNSKSGMGSQSMSYHKTASAYSMGTSTRAGNHMVIQPGFKAVSKMKTPGPGEYGSMSSVSKHQVLSNVKSPFSCGFGKGERLKSRKYESPGPGDYNPSSSVGKQPRSTTRTAPSYRFGTGRRLSINYGMVG